MDSDDAEDFDLYGVGWAILSWLGRKNI
jgi:hypothetical protein